LSWTTNGRVRSLFDAARLIDPDLHYEKLTAGATCCTAAARTVSRCPKKPLHRASGGAVTEVPA
jgi:hypothetical protein